MKNKKIFRITLTAVLASLALALSFIERLILSAFPLPMGIKPGFSNIIVMFACSVTGLIPSLSIAVIKAGFAALLSGVASGFISLCGGILSVLAMYILNKFPKDKLSYTGISVLSALMHNIGQLTAASLIAGSGLFGSFVPFLLISGIIFGLTTGTVLNIVFPHLKKLNIFDYKK